MEIGKSWTRQASGSARSSRRSTSTRRVPTPRYSGLRTMKVRAAWVCLLSLRKSEWNRKITLLQILLKVIHFRENRIFQHIFSWEFFISWNNLVDGKWSWIAEGWGGRGGILTGASWSAPSRSKRCWTELSVWFDFRVSFTQKWTENRALEYFGPVVREIEHWEWSMNEGGYTLFSPLGQVIANLQKHC